MLVYNYKILKYSENLLTNEGDEDPEFDLADNHENIYAMDENQARLVRTRKY